MTTNSIQFYSGTDATEVLRLSKDGVWANPEIPADEAAKLVLKAIDYNIKMLVQKAVADEREACVRVCQEEICNCCWTDEAQAAAEHISATIRARGQA